MTARPIWRQLEEQLAWRAFSRAWAKTGNRIAARMAMIAITTSNSINVNAWRRKTKLPLILSPFPFVITQERLVVIVPHPEALVNTLSSLRQGLFTTEARRHGGG